MNGYCRLLYLSSEVDQLCLIGYWQLDECNQSGDALINRLSSLAVPTIVSDSYQATDGVILFTTLFPFTDSQLLAPTRIYTNNVSLSQPGVCASRGIPRDRPGEIFPTYQGCSVLPRNKSHPGLDHI